MYTSTWIVHGRRTTVNHDVTGIEPGATRAAVMQALRQQAPEIPAIPMDFDEVVDNVWVAKSRQFREELAAKRERQKHRALKARGRAL